MILMHLLHMRNTFVDVSNANLPQIERYHLTASVDYSSGQLALPVIADA